MIALARIVVALLAQAQQIRWERPPTGTLARGLFWWKGSPRSAVALALAATGIVLAITFYRRLRRR